MPARTGPGFEHEDLFADYCRKHGVAVSAGTYKSCMNSIAAHLNQRLGPAVLRSESDTQEIIPRIQGTEFNRVQRSNYKSVLRKYVEMVRANFAGKFDAITPVAIDVVPSDLPERIRMEVSRIVRDGKTARELKHLYQGQCQLCGAHLEISPGEFYLEAHHLKPLGRPHDGPDVTQNMICVCPNCHVLLDFSAQKLSLARLNVSRHEIGEQFIAYHNEHCR